MFKKYEKIENVDLSKYSTMRTGGIGDVMVFPKNHLELKEIMKEIEDRHLRWYVVGNGSNVLFDDKGFRGVLINLKHFNKIVRNGDCVRVGAGVNLFALNLKLQEWGLSGLEWSFGIPATVGGFVIMNGGCFGNEIGQFIEEVIVLDNGKIKKLPKQKIQFFYRNSSLKSEKKVILSVKLRLFNDLNENIKQKMFYFYNKKKESQPCDLPSLGSVFKVIQTNPPVYPAKIIDNLGLKGVKINGAEVSTKHAGFIVNRGGATSADVLKLVCLLEEKMNSQGIFPYREIIILKEK